MGGVLHLPRALAVMEERGWDALLATSQENVYYLSGFRSFGQPLIRGTQVYALARRDRLEAPVVVAPVGEMDMAAQFPPRGTVIPYGTFHIMAPEEPVSGSDSLLVRWGIDEPSRPTAMEALLEALGRLDLTGGVIGVDERGLLPALWQGLPERLPDGLRAAPAADAFQVIRAVKTDREIEVLHRCASVVEQAMEQALASAEEGVPEQEMARVFEGALIALGARPLFSVIAFGSHAAYPNAVPGERRLRRGDLIRFDIGCLYQGYCSDIARTAVFGDPTPRQRDYYRAIAAGEEAALSVLRPGIAASAVFEAAVEATRKAGIPYYRRHHVGHGIGLEVYDLPLLAPGSRMTLESGMVLEVETPYYEVGFGGLQIEDTVVVTDAGCRLLTASDRTLRVV